MYRYSIQTTETQDSVHASREDDNTTEVHIKANVNTLFLSEQFTIVKSIDTYNV